MSRRSALLPASIGALGAGIALALAAGALLDPYVAPRVGPQPDTLVVRRAVFIERDDLADAAMAVFDTLRPRIYLNTRMLAQVGPDLAAFLRAHEEGHIAYHHVSVRRFGLVRVETPLPILHSYEFTADCYAGRVLRGRNPAAVSAALRFFQRRRDLVTDAEHPSMGARADSLLDCLTDPARRLPRGD